MGNACCTLESPVALTENSVPISDSSVGKIVLSSLYKQDNYFSFKDQQKIEFQDVKLQNKKGKTLESRMGPGAISPKKSL